MSDVKCVVVRLSGGKIVDPGDTKLRKKKEILAWELEGDGDLLVDFPVSPFGDPPQQPYCAGRFCVALCPPREGSESPATPGYTGRTYKYNIRVIRGGNKYTQDPNVEVIP